MAVNLEDSNCALIGSDEDKAARKEAAQGEEAWQVAGKEPGVQVWRVEQMKVNPWTKFDDKHIELHTGDSYIVLETTAGDDESVLDHDIFFWLGESTSIDERGVAAYKTVELDAYFDGQASQTREVEGHESRKFKELFPKISYLEGGISSGFRQTIDDAYLAHLYQIRKNGRSVVSKEVTLSRESLNQGDSFVLDSEKAIYVWSGDEASGTEKYEATAFAENLETSRGDGAAVTHDVDEEFWNILGGEGDIKSAAEAPARIPDVDVGEGILLKLSDADGELSMEEVGRGELNKSMLDSAAVMLLDRGSEIFVWIGNGASEAEKRNAFVSAMRFLKNNDRDEAIPIHLYTEGKNVKDPVWKEVFSD
jgi:gelsolin